MLTLSAAAARLGREVPEAEASIDDALLKVAHVLQTTISARSNNAVPAASAQPAIIRLHKTMGELIEAQNELLRAHGMLSQAGREVGVADENDCPPTTPMARDPERIAA